MTVTEQDKFGTELAAQRFQMLEDIAKELAGEVVFPTCFNVAVRIRQVLDDPNTSMEKIAVVVGGDPLVSTKLLALANSAAYAASQPVRDVRGAVQRLGLQSVRSISLAIAMKQLLLSRELVTFDELTIRLWQHSLLSASASSVVARHMTRINPDEAFLAGMVHDIGAFYMLYRAAQYPELSSRPESVKYLVAQWHDSIGQSVLGALGMPESIVEAARDHDQLREAPVPPKNLSDVVYIGNFLAGANFEWLYQDVDNATVHRFALAPQYLELSAEISEHAKTMGAVFA